MPSDRSRADDPPYDRRVTLPAIPWPKVLGLALAGTALAVALVLVDLHTTAERNGWLVRSGPDGPAHEVISRDFPDEPLDPWGEHDGTQYYAIARYPFDFDQGARNLDRPRYRYQRALFPYLSRAVALGATGPPLVWVMFAVGALAMLGGGIAAGALSSTLRGPPWPAMAFPLLPGALISLRITVADTMAVALVLGAVVCFLRHRDGLAIALGIAALLAKEPMLVTLAGVLLWSRDRRAVRFVAASIAPAAAWFAFLSWRFADAPADNSEFVVPFTGWRDSFELLWSKGSDTAAAVMGLIALTVALAALVRRGLGHPLGWPLVTNLVFLVPLGISVIGLDRNAPRILLPVLALGLVAFVAPGADPGADGVAGRERSLPGVCSTGLELDDPLVGEEIGEQRAGGPVEQA